MPGQQRQDNEREREWMRRLERERPDALSFAQSAPLEPGEGLPGPGAADAAAHRPSPRLAGDNSGDWGRELERDRLGAAMRTGMNPGGIPDVHGRISAEEIRRTFTSQELVNLAEMIMPEETAVIRRQVLGLARAEFASSAYEPGPDAMDDSPSAWKSQLERDRGSMTAIMGMSAFPGPGAAGGAAAADAGESSAPSKLADKVAERIAGSLMKSGLVEKINSLVVKFQKVTTVIQTRINIYATALEDFVVPSLVVLHPHKLMQDGVIKSFTQEVKSLMQSPEFAKFKKLLGPLGAFFSSKPVSFILWLAEKFLMAEWALVIFLDVVLVALILTILIILSYAACPFIPSCALSFTVEYIKSTLGIN